MPSRTRVSGPCLAGGVAERSRRFSGGGHRGVGYHLPFAGDPPRGSGGRTARSRGRRSTPMWRSMKASYAAGVERRIADGVDHPVGVDHLGRRSSRSGSRGTARGPPRRRSRSGHEQDERAAQQRPLEDRRRVVGDEDVGERPASRSSRRPAARPRRSPRRGVAAGSRFGCVLSTSAWSAGQRGAEPGRVEARHRPSCRARDRGRSARTARPSDRPGPGRRPVAGRARRPSPSASKKKSVRGAPSASTRSTGVRSAAPYGARVPSAGHDHVVVVAVQERPLGLGAAAVAVSTPNRLSAPDRVPQLDHRRARADAARRGSADRRCRR